MRMTFMTHKSSVLAAAGLFALIFCANGAFAPFAMASSSQANSASHAGLTQHDIDITRRPIRSKVVKMAPQSSLKLLNHATKVGPHAKSAQLRLTVVLRLNHATALRRFLQTAQDSNSVHYHQWLTPRQFTQRYGPTEAQVSAVKHFLHAHGIRVKGVSPNRLLIHTEATTGAYEHAFGIEINDYQLNGRHFYSTKNRPMLPRAIASLVMSVLGLNHGVRVRTYHYEKLSRQGTSGHRKSLSAAVATPPTSTTIFNPHQISEAYDWPDITNNANGNGISIAILGSQGSAMATNQSPEMFWSAYGLPDHPVSVTNIGGTSSAAQPMAELILDVSYSGAMAPGAKLHVYTVASPFISDLADVYSKFVTDDTSQVMTTSFGFAETAAPSAASADEQILMQGAAEGISMFAAAGDNGSSDGASSGNDNADFPSSSKYVTASNGTQLNISDDAGDYASEVVWNDSNCFGNGPEATGGAISQLFNEPPWQTGPGVPQNGHRNNSDLSMNASCTHPYWLLISGVNGLQSGWYNIGGTSAVAPQLAALFAIAVGEHGTRVGQSNKLIYDDVNADYYASDFRDVTQGNNGAFDAGPDWDHPTGWGSPKAKSLLDHIGFQGPHGTLAGKVTDEASGKPVAGATIVANPGNHRVKTGSDGDYSLPLPVGDYSVKAKAFGYASATQSVSISNGQSTTQNFQLTAAPTAAVSGQVTDGSGHGYGLYAEIRITTPGFGQVADVWTQVKNGHYDVNLPQGHKYTLTATAAFDGYKSKSVTISNLDNDKTENFSLNVTTACTAPGYGFVTGGLSQDFNGGTFPPSGWNVAHGPSDSVVWELSSSEPSNNGNYTGGAGAAADADSNVYGSGAGSYDTSLITPPIAVTSLPANPVLTYKANYIEFSGNEALDLDIKKAGASSWETILHWTSNHGTIYGTPGVTVRQDLEQYLPASGTFRLRWHYYNPVSDADYYAQIDDVTIGTCHALAGGLVYGQVSDRNSSKGLVGATVTANKGTSVETIKNPADPNLPVGSYEFFLPKGDHVLTASYPHYSPATAHISVSNDQVLKQDFSLKAGQLEAKPSGLALSVMVGAQAQKHVVLKNTGSAQAHFHIIPINAPPPETAPAAGRGAPLAKVRVKNPTFERADISWIRTHGSTNGRRPPSVMPYGPAETTPHAAPWSGISDYPMKIADNAMAHDNATGKVYSVGGFNGSGALASAFVYNPDSNAWTPIAAATVARKAPAAGFADGRLYLVNGWDVNGRSVGELDVYDPATQAWNVGLANPQPAGGGSAAGVVNGKLYVVGGCTDAKCGSELSSVEVYNPASGTWSAAHDYPHNVAFAACGGIKGKLYCAGGLAPSSGQFMDGYVYDPTTDGWHSIANLPVAGGVGAARYAAANGKLLLVGGFVGNTGAITNQGEAYDPSSDSWGVLPNANYATARGAGACGFYKAGGITGLTLFNEPKLTAKTELLPGYGGLCGAAPSIPWLTVAPAQGTINAGAREKVTLTFDGTREQKYTTSKAYLRVEGNTPYPARIVPLTVHWTARPVHLVLSASAESAGQTVKKGSNLAYTVTVKNKKLKNHGTATRTSVHYRLPSGANYVTALGEASCTAPDAGSAMAPAVATSSPDEVVCHFGKLAQGASKTETIVIKPTQAGTLKSTFTATAREPQQPANGNTATVKTRVLGKADLGVSISGASITLGGTGTLNAKVINAGPDPADGVKIELSVSGSAVTLGSATSSVGSCSPGSSGKGLTCNIGSLASGATAKISIKASGVSVGSATLTAHVTSASDDPSASNNVATARVTVKAPNHGGGNNNGGGGGAFGWLALAALLGLVGLGYRRRHA